MEADEPDLIDYLIYCMFWEPGNDRLNRVMWGSAMGIPVAIKLRQQIACRLVAVADQLRAGGAGTVADDYDQAASIVRNWTPDGLQKPC